MPLITCSAELRCPPEHLFALVADWSSHARWQPSLADSSGPAPGDLAPGSRLVEVRAAFGQRVRSELEVTSVEPGCRVAARSISGPMKAEQSYLVEPCGEGSRLTIEWRLDPPLVLKMVEGMFAPEMRREAENSLRNLDALVGGAEPPVPVWTFAA